MKNISRKTILLLEFTCIFLGIPLFFYFEILPVPKIPFLMVATGIILVILINSRYFQDRSLWDFQNIRPFIRIFLLRFFMVIVFLTGITLIFFPESLFRLPRQKPWFWLALLVLYPVFSAFPQELIYRGYFFFRYQPLFRSRTVLITASILSFSFLHIIYYNIIAVLLTLFGGYLFTHTYIRTNSLLFAGLEHSLYGCMIFTIGPGQFFY